MKHCNSCNQTKALCDFGKDIHSKTGYTDYCKECRNAQARERASRNPEIYKRRNEKHKHSMKFENL